MVNEGHSNPSLSASSSPQVRQASAKRPKNTTQSPASRGFFVSGRPLTTACALAEVDATLRGRPQAVVSRIRVLNQIPMFWKLSLSMAADSVAVAGVPLTIVLPPLEATFMLAVAASYW